MIFKIPVL